MAQAGPSYTSKAPAAAGVAVQHPGAGTIFVNDAEAVSQDAWDGQVSRNSATPFTVPR